MIRLPKRRPTSEHRLVFARRIRLRNGRVLLAEHYGLRAFAFWAKPRKR